MALMSSLGPVVVYYQIPITEQFLLSTVSFHESAWESKNQAPCPFAFQLLGDIPLVQISFPLYAGSMGIV